MSFNQPGNTNYSAAPTVSSSTQAAKTSSTVKITSNTPNPSAPGQAVAVNFQASGNGTPTGMVTVAASTGESCAGALSSGAGNCSITFVSVGYRTLTATYPGDANFTATTSANVTQSVNGPLASVSPSSLNFGTVYLGTITVKSVTVTNVGNAPMTISTPFFSIASGGDSKEFAEVNLCPGSLAAGKSCTIEVGFMAGPSYNPQTAILSVVDNAYGSPENVSLTAAVINPLADLSATSLNFASEKVGTTSAPQSVKLTNMGTTPLVLSSVSITGNFALASGTTCGKGTALAPSSSCLFSVTFTPTVHGTLTGSVTIADNARVNQQIVSLTGKGM